MATGISSSFTPRKEAQELGGLTIKGEAPSIGINSFSRGINVTPQQAVQFGAPYVSTQQTANFINSLGQFNDAVRSFGISYNKYDTEQNALQGEADAATIDPEVRARLFNELKGNVDKAVEEGLLPKAMHPVYKMNLIQDLAAAHTRQELPNVLEAKRQELTSWDATNIGGKLAQTEEEWRRSRFTDPLSQIAAAKAAAPIVYQTQNQFEARRNANFDETSVNTQADKKRGGLQTILDGLRSKDQTLVDVGISTLNQRTSGVNDQSKFAAETAAEWIEQQVEARRLDPEGKAGMSLDEADKMRVYLKSQLKGGTGLVADTRTGGEAFGKLDKYMTTTIHQERSRIAGLTEQVDKQLRNMGQNYYLQVLKGSKIAGIEDSQKEEVAKLFMKADPSLNYADAYRKAEESANESLKYWKNREQSDDVILNIQKLREAGRLDDADAMAADAQKRGLLTYKGADDELNKTKKLKAVDGALKDADYEQQYLSPIKTHAQRLYEGSLVPDALDPDKQKKIEQLWRFGTDTLNRLANNEARKMLEDPAMVQLRQDRPEEFRAKLQERLNSHYESVTQKIDQYKAKLDNDPKFSLSNYSILGQYTPKANQYRYVTEAMTSNPSKLTDEDKLVYTEIPKEMRSLLNTIKFGTPEEKEKATNAYVEYRRNYGLNPDHVLAGKDDNGIPVNPEEYQFKDFVFQTPQQYAAFANNPQKAKQLMDKLNIPEDKRAVWAEYQKQMLGYRTPAPIQQQVKDPTFPKTKADAGIPAYSQNNPQAVAIKKREEAPTIVPPPSKKEVDQYKEGKARLSAAMKASYQTSLTRINNRISQLEGMAASGFTDKGFADEWETLNKQKAELETALSKIKK